jgi:hypothetical protein
VFGCIPDKNTRNGAWGKFVGYSGHGIGVAEAPIYAEMMVARGCGEEGFVRGFEVEGFCWPNVNKVSSGVKSLGPVVRRHGGLEEDGSKNVVGGANCTLGFPVLGGGVGAGKTKNSAERREEGAVCRVIEFLAVVALDRANGGEKMCSYEGMEIN